MNRIVVVVPQINRLGGVSLHYKGLRKYWTEDVHYCEQRVYKKNGLVYKIGVSLANLITFLAVLIRQRPSHIIFNTSLKRGFYSQYYLWRISKALNYKTGLFIHGWDVEKEDSYLDSFKCQKYLKGVDGIFLLGASFKQAIEKRGIATPVYVVTTKVDNELLDGFDYSKKVFLNRRFLFVARLIRQKGVFEAIEAFRIIQKAIPDVTFNIVGDGSDREEVEKFINDNHVANVSFKGELYGSQLTKAYSEADYYFLLSYSEGLPSSLLEAMSFGLVPIVRNVGGIPEVFKDGEMGIMSESLDPEYYAQRIMEVMANPQIAREISQNNYNIGQEKFLASAVAKRFEAMVLSL